MHKRRTKQKSILENETDKINHFFTAEELLEKAKKKDPNMGIATVYRFLKDMKNNKRLFSYVCNRRMIYSKDKRSHCHFICEKTGKTIHFDIESLDFLKNKIPGEITSFQLEVRGICRDCENESCSTRKKI